MTRCYKCKNTKLPLNSEGLCECCGEPDEGWSGAASGELGDTRQELTRRPQVDRGIATDTNAAEGSMPGNVVPDSPTLVRECAYCPAPARPDSHFCLHCAVAQYL